MPAWLGPCMVVCRPYLVATVVSWNLQFLQTAATPIGNTVGSSLSTSPPKRVNSCGMKPSKFIQGLDATLLHSKDYVSASHRRVVGAGNDRSAGLVDVDEKRSQGRSGDFRLHIIAADILQVNRRAQRQRQLEDTFYIQTVRVSQCRQVERISTGGEAAAEGKLDEDGKVAVTGPSCVIDDCS